MGVLAQDMTWYVSKDGGNLWTVLSLNMQVPGTELVPSALAVDRYLYFMSHLLNCTSITIIRLSCRVTWSCAKQI